MTAKTEEEIRAAIEAQEYDTKLSYPYNDLEGRKAYRMDQARLDEVFRSDLEGLFEMTLHPKREIIWLMAWAHGHSEGLVRVMEEYEELHQLITPI